MDQQVSLGADFRSRGSGFSRVPWSRFDVVIASLMMNLLSLALPIVLLQVYDRIVPNNAKETLVLLVAGVACALILETIIRLARTYVTGWAGACFEHSAGNSALDALLNAEIASFEKEAAGVHLDRLSGVEAMRDFYSGQVVLIFVDLPFSILFLILIGFLGGALVVVPVVIFPLFAITAAIIGSRLRSALDRRANADDRRYNFLIEVLKGIHTVKAMAMEALMVRRFESLQETCAGAGHEVTKLSAIANSAGSIFSQLTMIGVVAFGAIFVIDGSLSIGGLATVSSTNLRGEVYVFSRLDETADARTRGRVNWFRWVSERFRPLAYQALAMTFLLNLLALATPLFVMAVYDRVVATGSLTTLTNIAIGVAIAILCDGGLRFGRARLVAYIGARIDMIVGTSVFQQILYLPPAFTERASVGSQVARLTEFESIREFFTGALVLVFLELPFVIIFITVIWLLGGNLASVPVVTIGVFFVFGLIIHPMSQNIVEESTNSTGRRKNFLVEALTNARELKCCGAVDNWRERFSELSASAATVNFRNGQLSALIGTISHVLMTTSAAAIIMIGTLKVIDGEMSVGAMVAVMILVWRVLAPLQSGLVALSRLQKVRLGVQRINDLMKIRPEREPFAQPLTARNFVGQIDFNRVSLRYGATADPALIGASFSLSAGTIATVAGSNGAGKSTILKLIAGLYQPQAGSIFIDGVDIRQIDPLQLRAAIGYVPQVCHLFRGTIAQNLRLAHPTASRDELELAADRAAILEDILALPEGFSTRIGDYKSSQLPSEFCQRLSLARAYVKCPAILLLDEPVNNLDSLGDEAFAQAIEHFRSESTIIMVTHRPSHIRLADQVIYLRNAHVAFAGPREEAERKLSI